MPPVEEALAQARTPGEVFAAVEAAWDHDYGRISHTVSHAEAEVARGVGPVGLWWRFATGGWSHNEALIRLLRQNGLARLCWRLSAAGGLHIYEEPLETPHD